MTVPLLNMEKQVRVTVIPMCNRKVGLLPLSIMLTLNASYKILLVNNNNVPKPLLFHLLFSDVLRAESEIWLPLPHSHDSRDG